MEYRTYKIEHRAQNTEHRTRNKKMLRAPCSVLRAAGFTLVETLVALFIFTSSITALIVVTGSGVSNTTIAKNRFAAVALAQEGVEMIHNIRDTYVLSDGGAGTGWTDFTTDLIDCFDPEGCYIENPTGFFDGSLPDVIGCPPEDSGGCPYLEREFLSSDPNDPSLTYGYFGYTGPNQTPTPFKRTLRLEPVGGSGEEILVTSTVSWRQGSTVRQVSASEHLFNWFALEAPTP